MKNKDMVVIAFFAGFVLLIWVIMNQHPANPVRNTEAPLPINLKTNGVANGNTNDVASRVYFQQQPT